ncbi:MAG: hypothetical protein JWQ49_4988 [Edaphobacter sp.]|nr:hypothetical protein [Edaphobacter sp.]
MMKVSIATRVVRSCRAEQAKIDTLIISMKHLLSSANIDSPRYIESEIELLQAERSIWEGDIASAKAKGGRE